MTAMGSFFPRRINQHVPNMQYSADVRFGGAGTVVIPAPAAADVDLFGAALDADAVIGTELLAAGAVFTVDAKFGRNVTLTASAATGASAVYRIRGRDYLGQMMYEDITVANADATTTKVGKKAFKHVESVKPVGVTAASAVTLSLGVGNVLGLPYKTLKLYGELVDKVVPTAGTFVDGLTTGTAQTGVTDDTRGTYTPQASFVPNGSREYTLNCHFDNANLHGDAQAVV